MKRFLSLFVFFTLGASVLTGASWLAFGWKRHTAAKIGGTAAYNQGRTQGTHVEPPPKAITLDEYSLLNGMCCRLGLRKGFMLAEDETPVCDAMDIKAIRDRAGAEVFVVGQVTNVDTIEDGEITIINVGMPKQGFFAVIFRKHSEEFPEGFEKFRGKNVKVRGAIHLYTAVQPLIVLLSPEQISIVTE
jgi:hypothetical protein